MEKLSGLPTAEKQRAVSNLIRLLQQVNPSEASSENILQDQVTVPSKPKRGRKKKSLVAVGDPNDPPLERPKQQRKTRSIANGDEEQGSLTNGAVSNEEQASEILHSESQRERKSRSTSNNISLVLPPITSVVSDVNVDFDTDPALISQLNSSTKSALLNAQPSTSFAPIHAPAAKKKGRPRKIALINEVPLPPKKKRGRPQKNLQLDREIQPDVSQNSTPLKVKQTPKSAAKQKGTQNIRKAKGDTDEIALAKRQKRKHKEITDNVSEQPKKRQRKNAIKKSDCLFSRSEVIPIDSEQRKKLSSDRYPLIKLIAVAVHSTSIQQESQKNTTN